MSKRAKTTTHLRMNTHFDTAKARAALEQMYKRPTDASSDDTEMDLVGGTANSTYVRRIKYPPSLRMMAWDGTEDVEVTVKLRGILCGFSLPPVAKPESNKLSQLRNLRQHVKVTALGLDAFDQAMANLLQIHGMFSSFVGSAEAVQPLDFLPYEGNPSIDSHARYFTDRHLSPYEKNEPLSHWIDPERALTAIQPPTFIHGPDNIVDYCTLMGDEYALHDPKLFKAGDIVEISFSCVAIPVKGSAYKLILNLRALTLIDDQLRLESERALADTIKHVSMEPPSPKKLKRRRVVIGRAGESTGSTDSEANKEGTEEHETKRKRDSGRMESTTEREGGVGALQANLAGMDIDNA